MRSRLAFVGLVLVSGPDAVQLGALGVGEAATILGAVAIAFLSMPLVEEGIPAFSWVWCVSAVGLGMVSALIQLTMNWAQKSVSPTKATLIYATEPVWAGIVGRVAGERLPGLALLGAVCIEAGVVASECRPRWFRPRAAAPRNP